MQASDLRIALFSGNYNYVRDGANQALNRLVGYLLRQATGIHRHRMEQVLAEFGITAPQFSVLTMLSAYPGISNADVARLGRRRGGRGAAARRKSPGEVVADEPADPTGDQIDHHVA